jgi:hypothetical protein
LTRGAGTRGWRSRAKIALGRTLSGGAIEHLRAARGMWPRLFLHRLANCVGMAASFEAVRDGLGAKLTFRQGECGSRDWVAKHDQALIAGFL